jgi:signal transduction histidine kinase
MQPPEKADRVRRAVDDLDATIKEIRTSIFALQNPAPHAGEGVRTAVLTTTQTAAATLGYEPQVVLNGAIDTLVPAAVGEQLVAVLREALSNVARHAGATVVTVTVTADPQQVDLVVEDNGKGMPEGGRRSGLANLELRATNLGGAFSAHSGATGGTVVHWSVPLG